MPKAPKQLLIALSVFVFTSIGHSQVYEVGDIVENFTLTDRSTNQPVSLYDMEGKSYFLSGLPIGVPFARRQRQTSDQGSLITTTILRKSQ